MVLITILALGVLAFVGKLIYDVQQKKNTPTKNEYWGYSKEAFQKLAGIGVPKPDKNTEVINGYKELAEKWTKAGFPEPDASIPVTATKITTIDTNFGSDNDPLASVPMSRVSKEAKQKMAEIAKEDINIQIEKNVEKFATLTNQTKCGCGRSETGFCTGLHRIPKKAWADGVRDIPAEKPKRKYTKKATK
jgi:hypothetical protein